MRCSLLPERQYASCKTSNSGPIAEKRQLDNPTAPNPAPFEATVAFVSSISTSRDASASSGDRRYGSAAMPAVAGRGGDDSVSMQTAPECRRLNGFILAVR